MHKTLVHFVSRLNITNILQTWLKTVKTKNNRSNNWEDYGTKIVFSHFISQVVIRDTTSEKKHTSINYFQSLTYNMQYTE